MTQIRFAPSPEKIKPFSFKPGQRDNRQSGKTLTHPCPLGSRHPWRFTLSFFCRLIPCVLQLCQKQKNNKIQKRNQSAKSSALWQGGKGRIPGSIHQYVTRNSECSQHSHRVEDDADSLNHFVCGMRQSEDIPGSIHQYVTGVAERSQRRHSTKRRVTLNHSPCGKAATEGNRGAYNGM